MESAKEDPGIFVTHRYRVTGQLVRVVPDSKTYWFSTGAARVLTQSVTEPADVKWATEDELEPV